MTQLPHKSTHFSSSILLSALHVNSIWLTGHPISSFVILWPIQITCPVVILLQQTKKGNFSQIAENLWFEDLKTTTPLWAYHHQDDGLRIFKALAIPNPQNHEDVWRIFGTIKVIYHPTSHPTCQTHHPLAGGFNAISGDWIHILFNHVLQSSSTNKKRDTSWWFQPLWKIWSSNWTISSGDRGKNKQSLSCHHLGNRETHSDPGPIYSFETHLPPTWRLGLPDNTHAQGFLG